MLKSTLKAKYEAERNKRIRPDGHKQYLDFRLPQFAHLNKDPWIDYDSLAAKQPDLNAGDAIKVLVVGGGHAAICFAYRLFETGISGSDICIVDVAGGLGGTWYWNRYPGLMCDVEGYVYLPMLEETGYMPKHRYSYGKEIREQSERIAKQAGFKTMFSTKVNSLQWDEKAGCWIATMIQDLGVDHDKREFTVKAQFVFVSGGPFISPRFPDGPGFQDFASKNQVFHTARWQYDISGGSEDKQDLTLFKDKTVAVVGTGATGIQVVPAVAKWAKQLYVVQRTPCYVGPRDQRETDPAHWAKVAGQKGWQHERQVNFNRFITNDPAPVDLVNDGWSESRSFGAIIGTPKIVTPDSIQQHLDALISVDTPRTEALRAHIEKEVHDKETAEKLKPWYYGWCKRPSFHDDYLSAFNRPNVKLIDTNGNGLQSYTKTGIVADGVEYQVDVLILATGFATGNTSDRGLEQSAGMSITGRNGRSLGDKWASPEAGTLMGIMTEGFPNMFMSTSSGGGTSANLTSTYDMAARLCAHVLKVAMARTKHSNRLVIVPSKEGEKAYGQELVKRALNFSALGPCTPGYFTGDQVITGKRDQNTRPATLTPWGQGPVSFQRLIDEYQKDDTLEGFVVTT